MANILEGLEPQPVWEIFEQISRIPRCSKNEEKLQDWMKGWAKENGVGFKKDDVGNVLLTRKAASGYQNIPSILLQAHQDMVCEKTPESGHKFGSDPIPLVVKGGSVEAYNTSLGADNGAGMALVMALLVEESLENHGQIEALFTVDEEAEFTGIRNLKAEFFESKLMINLDSEEAGVVIVSSAGGGGTNYSVSFRPKDQGNREGLRVEVGGLLGGHSGVDIHLPRYNANKLLAEGLLKLHKELPIRIIEFEGGTRGNAIPRNARADILVQKGKSEKSIQILKDWEKGLDKSTEKGLVISVKTERAKPAAPVNETEKLLKLVSKIPFGPKSWSKDFENLVQTSNNNGIIRTVDNTFKVSTYSRTCDSVDFYDNQRILYELGQDLGVKTEQRVGGSGWKADPKSPLLKVVTDVYASVLGKAPVVTGIHGGLECGVVAGLKKGIDIVSIGPTIRSPHSPSESIEIKSVETLWKLLLKVVPELTRLG
jgi:dipeptidase D